MRRFSLPSSVSPSFSFCLLVPILFLVLSPACSSSSGTGGEPSMDALEGGLTADAEPDNGRGDDEVFALSCKTGDTACINGKLATCDPKFGWLLEACPEGTVCEDGQCRKSECEPLSARCTDGGVQICAPDGNGWSDVMPCPKDTQCQDGVCVEPDCEPGAALCAGNLLLECAEDGESWTSTPCPDGTVCFDGQCIECIGDEDCLEGESCEDGECIVPPLVIVTTSLPDGKIGETYQVALKAEGGVAPYAWTLTDGALPAGLELQGSGLLAGQPEDEGSFAILVQVEDKAGATAQKEFTFTVFAAAAELLITTGSPLPAGEEGTPYQTTLNATGGQEPYFWGISQGALPAGLTLASGGVIGGVPADHGDFAFTVKVFDDGAPPSMGQKEFAVTIKIAPLEIVGDQMFDLWITKIIVLPMCTAIEGIPIPYSVDLQAKGGVKPYHWAEQELPGFVSYLIPNGGIPTGLSLEEDGQLHGAVTDPATAVNVKIPFTQIDLTGFFFMAEVKDSQDPADSATAIYLIPTLPVSF